VGVGAVIAFLPLNEKNDQEEVFMTRLGSAPALSRNERSAHGNASS